MFSWTPTPYLVYLYFLCAFCIIVDEGSKMCFRSSPWHALILQLLAPSISINLPFSCDIVNKLRLYLRLIRSVRSDSSSSTDRKHDYLFAVGLTVFLDGSVCNCMALNQIDSAWLGIDSVTDPHLTTETFQIESIPLAFRVPSKSFLSNFIVFMWPYNTKFGHSFQSYPAG